MKDHSEKKNIISVVNELLLSWEVTCPSSFQNPTLGVSIPG